MSFILDALRKSESERRMEAAPDVMRVPLAVQRSRLPAWAAVLIVLLTTALVSAVMGFWWLEEGRDENVARSVPEELGGSRRPFSGVGPVDAQPEPATASRSVATSAPAAPEPESIAADEAAEGPPVSARTGPREAEAAAGTSTPGVQTTVAPARELVTDKALIAQGIAIPQLDLQLHVFSSEPVRRFVLINGRRYSQGTRLDEGPELVAVTAEGAVLRYLGRDFLLLAD
jgi:general secretion pathway protein B